MRTIRHIEAGAAMRARANVRVLTLRVFIKNDFHAAALSLRQHTVQISERDTDDRHHTVVDELTTLCAEQVFHTSDPCEQHIYILVQDIACQVVSAETGKIR